jgi:hypothetical protein
LESERSAITIIFIDCGLTSNRKKARLEMDGPDDAETGAFTSSDVPKPGPRQWRRKVSLRLAMVLVLLIALGLAWFAHGIREQRLAKDLILRHDGVFFYEFEPQTVTRYTRTTFVPAWLRNLIGENSFHDVTWVRIEGSQFGDSELKQLQALDQIESLGIVETAITDDGLRHPGDALLSRASSSVATGSETAESIDWTWPRCPS